jgi:hypothetical protein
MEADFAGFLGGHPKGYRRRAPTRGALWYLSAGQIMIGFGPIAARYHRTRYQHQSRGEHQPFVDDFPALSVPIEEHSKC